MDNLNLTLISGGYHHCTPEWNEDHIKSNCYKIYFPVEGNAEIMLNGKWYRLVEGNAYFINGFFLERQRCEDYMKVYWYHFLPESQLLSLYLNSLKSVFEWESTSNVYKLINYKQIPLVFDDPASKASKPAKSASLSQLCYINSATLLLLSDLLSKQQVDLIEINGDLYKKLSPAVEFINKNFSKNLKLDEIASKAYLNPAYFLRLFKKCFKQTPNQYLTIKRMDEARRLLGNTELSIREISERTGFCNQFYFSKVFKNYFHKPPYEFRNTKIAP